MKLKFLSFYEKCLILTFSSSFLLQGCMTSQRQDQLQSSLGQVQDQINQLQDRITKREQQITNTTQTAISSRNDVENLHSQILIMQGDIDTLNKKVVTIQKEASGQEKEKNIISQDNHANSLIEIQRKLARVELASNAKVAAFRTSKLPAKLQSLDKIKTSLKNTFAKNEFKQTIETCNAVLNSTDASEDMLQIAIEYRAEAKLKLNDYRGAALDILNYIDLFPKGEYYSKALFLAGNFFNNLKNFEVAKSYYQECEKYCTLPAYKTKATNNLSKMTAQMSVNLED
jgi:TolA-binding protein